MAYIIQCDRCSTQGGKGDNNFQPKGWTAVGLSIEIVGGRRHKFHQFCPECVEYLDLKTEMVEETSAEKLVSILESMVEEAVDERDS